MSLLKPPFLNNMSLVLGTDSISSHISVFIGPVRRFTTLLLYVFLTQQPSACSNKVQSRCR